MDSRLAPVGGVEAACSMLFPRVLALGVGRLAVSAALVAGSSFAQFNTETVDGREVVAREVLVKFRPLQGPVALQASTLVDQAALSVQSESVHPLGRRGAMRIRSRSMSVEAIIKRLLQNPQVEWAEPNYIIRATDTTPNDTLFPSQFDLKNTGQVVGGQAGTALADISAVKAWDSTIGSTAVAIGVVDSGIDYTHVDLNANVWTATVPYDITVGATIVHCPIGSHGINVRNLSCDPMDDNGHGSHVSGTMGAVGNNASGIAGVNWKTSMVGIKILNQFGTGSEADAVNGIEAAIQLKALGVNIRVINASWGGPVVSTPLQQAITDAKNADILFIAAAGNDGVSMETIPYYPAAYTHDNIISVAATDNQDKLADFSNFSPTSVDLGAPGVNILSTVPLNTYLYASGTSMATPHVTGAAALLLSACTLTTMQLRDLILNSVDLVPALSGKTLTGGRLNLNHAMSVCMAMPKADFTLTANPTNVSVLAPATTSSTISVNPLNGFNGTVTFTAQGLPTGVTASFAPPTVTGGGSTSVTFTAAVGATVGSFPITIQGTSGLLAASTVVTLAVNTKDFLLSVGSPSLTIAAGGTVGTSVGIAPLFGFAGTVDLSIDGLPPGVTAIFQPPALTGLSSSSLTFTASNIAVPGVYTLTVHGISGFLVKNLNVKLTVTPAQDFLLNVAPSSVTIAPGSPGTATVTTMSVFQFAGPITFSAIGLPGGVTANFAPNPMTPNAATGIGTSTVTFSASGALPATYPITIQATSGALTHTAAFSLVVLGSLPAITISAPSNINPGDDVQVALFLAQGSPGGVTVDVQNSNSGGATLNTSTIFFPSNVTSSGKLRIKGNSPGTVTITASAPGYQTATKLIMVGGAAPPLSISTSSLNVGQVGVAFSQQLFATGGSGGYTWTLVGAPPAGFGITSSGLFSGTSAVPLNTPVTFKVTDSGAPVNQTATATLNLVINAAATPNSITVSGGGLQSTTRNTAFALALQATVRDALSNPMPNVTVTFTAPAPAGASGFFSNGLPTITATTNFLGIASVAFAANNNLGSYMVNATVAGVATPAVFNLTNTNSTGPAINLSISPVVTIGQPSQLAVFLASPAPAGGLTVTFRLSDPNKGTMNSFDTFIPGGQSSTGRPAFTGKLTGTETITASAPGYSPGMATVQVTP